MRKARIILVIIAVAVLVAGAGFFLFSVLRPKAAGILIETTPEATIYIDGEQVGKSPYSETLDPREVVIKLVPESFEKPLIPYETRIVLVPGVETVIRRVFGEDINRASGEIVSFEKISRNETGLAVVAIPDASQVSVDGKNKVFAPYKTSDIAPGEHLIVVSAEGYEDKPVKVRTHQGFKLTAFIQLAKSQINGNETDEDLSELEKEKVETVKKIEILPTGVDFLRVRSEPSTLGQEVARVSPGDKYLYLSEDEETGWYKIEYEEGKNGWVSNEYSKVVEEDLQKESGSDDETSVSPTP